MSEASKYLHAGSLARLAVAALLLLLTGCASLPPYATEDSMADRAKCLRDGWLWIESQDVYDCRPPRPRERT